MERGVTQGSDARYKDKGGDGVVVAKEPGTAIQRKQDLTHCKAKMIIG